MVTRATRQQWLCAWIDIAVARGWQFWRAGARHGRETGHAVSGWDASTRPLTAFPSERFPRCPVCPKTCVAFALNGPRPRAMGKCCAPLARLASADPCRLYHVPQIVRTSMPPKKCSAKQFLLYLIGFRVTVVPPLVSRITCEGAVFCAGPVA